MRVSPQSAQRSTWPPSKAVRQASIAAMTRRWACESRSLCVARKASPWRRKMSATSSPGRMRADHAAGITLSERRSSGDGVLAIRVVATWAYREVEASSTWPSRTWMMRMSVPLSKRCVAKLCRKLCAVTGLPIFACRRARRQASC